MAGTVAELMVKVGLLGADSIQKGLKKVERDLKEIGRGLTQALTIPIAGIATAAFASSTEARLAFEDFARRVKSSMGILGSDIARSINLDKLLGSISAAIEGAVHWFTSLSDTTKDWIVGVLAAAAALGPLALALAKVVEVVRILRGVFLTLSTFLLSPSAWPLLLIGGIVAGGIALAAYISHLQETKSAIQEVGKAAANTKTELQVYTPAKMAMPNLRQRAGLDFNTPQADTRTLRQRAGLGPESPGSFSEQGPLQSQGGPSPQHAAAAAAKTPRFRLTGTEESKAFEAAIEKTNQGLREMSDRQQNLGEVVNVVKEKHDLLKQEMLAIAKIPQGRESERFKEDAAQLSTLNEKLIEQQASLYTLAGAWGAFQNAILQIPPLAIQVSQGMMEIFNAFTAGVGNSIASVLVYGGSFAKLIKDLFKQVLATVISTFVQIAIQQAIAAIAAKIFASVVGAANIGVSVARAGAAAYAAAVESQGLLGIGTGFAFASLAIAGATKMALFGKAAGMLAGGLAEGGIAMRPTYRLFGEAGPEAVLPLTKLRGMIGSMLGPRSIQNHVEIDGHEIALIITRLQPDILMQQGIRT